jgi:C4-dicarboxylate transporter DctM subunit
MSGSSVACVAAIGKLTLPSLEKAGYGRTFSLSIITATGVIVAIIPTSIPMIIYAVTAQQPVNVLFTAGILPGILVAIALAAYVMMRAHWQVIPLGAPFVILGGIYGGIFTATEAAGVAC